MKKLLVTAAALGFVLGYVATAQATNGYFAHGYSIKNKGLAGAGVALPLDALAASVNPAGMTEVGSRVDLGVSLFSPSRSYEIKGDPTPPQNFPPNCQENGNCPFGLIPGDEDSDSEYFVIPSFGFNHMLTDHSSIGVSIYGNGGMNTDYDTNTFNVNPQLPGYGNDPTGVDLIQLFIATTYAHKFVDKHSFGITPIIAMQRFEAQGLHIFGEAGFSKYPNDLTNNGHDTAWGFGARVGYLGQLTEQFSIGASYQTEINMEEFDDYRGLFAEEGDFDIPKNFTLGFVFKPIPTVRLAFDWQKIYYGDVDSIANPMLPNLMMAPLGDDDGAGFGWEDMDIFKFGLEWERTEQWTYRFGYSYSDDQPIPDSEVMFNILAPGVIEQHVTFGFTRTFESQNELNFAFMYALNNDVEGPNPLEFPGAQKIELEMDQWEVSLGYSWVF